MATALPFPAHKHSPRKARPMSLLDVRVPGLPADQGSATALPESSIGEEPTGPHNLNDIPNGVPGSPNTGLPNSSSFATLPNPPDPGTLPSIPNPHNVPNLPVSPQLAHVPPAIAASDMGSIPGAPSSPTIPPVPDAGTLPSLSDDLIPMPKGKK